MANGTPTYVLNLKLETELFQDDILDKRFEIGRKLYNSVSNVAQKRYYEMVKTKSWRENQKNIADVYKSEKDSNKAKTLCIPYFKIRKDLLKKYGCTEYSLHEVVKTMQHHYKKNMDSYFSSFFKILFTLLYSSSVISPLASRSSKISKDLLLLILLMTPFFLTIL